jgi:ribosomal-protein-alanine N-acetyltransferase
MTADPCEVRFYIRRDLPELMEIDRESYRPALNEDEWQDKFRQRNAVGLVAELDGQVIGFLVYELHKKKYEIYRLGVLPEFRRTGVASTLIAKLLHKLSGDRRSEVEICSDDRNLPGHLFLRACGFKAVDIYRDQVDKGHDAYRFLFTVEERKMATA